MHKKECHLTEDRETHQCNAHQFRFGICLNICTWKLPNLFLGTVKLESFYHLVCDIHEVDTLVWSIIGNCTYGLARHPVTRCEITYWAQWPTPTVEAEIWRGEIEESRRERIGRNLIPSEISGDGISLREEGDYPTCDVCQDSLCACDLSFSLSHILSHCHRTFSNEITIRSHSTF